MPQPDLAVRSTTETRPVPVGLAKTRIGFALEYVLGHITHSDNLKRTLEGDSTVAPAYVDLPYHDDKLLLPSVTRLPGIRSNWSLRASLGAYMGLRRGVRNKEFDSLFFHTQAASLFSTAFMREIPSVISLDATPIQYDTLGKHYGHTSGRNISIENLKKRLNERALSAAQGIITWSEWAKDGLIKDYGVPAEKITVIPPGIDAEKWDFAVERAQREGIPGVTRPVNLLFVGGDFFRKGGDTLLDALRELPANANVHLDIVTKADDLGKKPLPDRVSVHRGMTPNSAPLRKLYAEADVFVFPTRADCLPLAVMEALAAGLPVITTDIGALPEAVTHGENGWIIPTDDPPALTNALRRLTSDAGLRNQLAANARETGRTRFDAVTNYRRLAETIKKTSPYTGNGK